LGIGIEDLRFRQCVVSSSLPSRQAGGVKNVGRLYRKGGETQSFAVSQQRRRIVSFVSRQKKEEQSS